jgi:hypothetical protein
MHTARVSPREGAWLLRPGRGKRRQQMTHRREWTIRPQIVASGAEYRQGHPSARFQQ